MRRLSSYGPSLMVLGTTAVVLLAGPSAVWHLTHAQARARIIQASKGLEQNPILEQLNQAYRDIAAVVEPSVVHISTERMIVTRWGERQRSGSSGSGWVYDEKGHIVTNFHVIEDADRIEVQLYSGEMREAEVVGVDELTDIAVIKIDPGRLFPAIRAVPSEHNGFRTARQGDLVFAFGSPFDFRFSMSSGVISGIGRSARVIRTNHNLLGYENFIQVDAAINPGNSGGPLTNAQGRVIGMNTAIATSNGNGMDEGQFAGIGLAIPIDMIEPVVSQIVQTGSVQKGFLGVSVVESTQTIAYELEFLRFRGYGLTVGRIDLGNPALDAGLLLGDVITHVNRQPVPTLTQLELVTADIRPDDVVELAVWRYDGDTDSSARHKITLPGVVANGFRGINLLQLYQDIDDWLKLLGFRGRGVRIARLDLDKPARNAGLKHRDVVTHVNEEEVGSVPQLRSKISSMLPGDVARLRIWRYEPKLGRDRVLTIDVKLDRLDEMRVFGLIPKDRRNEAIENLGIERLTTSTPELADAYGIPYRRGVLVQEIVEGSALGDIMPPRSVIVAVMERIVRSDEEFYTALDEFDLRRGVRITFIRPDGKRDQLTLRTR